jgi:predicted membrane chloride channel (bestrophin family)
MIMRKNWALKGIKFALFAVLFFTVFSFVVMNLWNWLMPALFSVHVITFWQAVGILVLSKILFGGFRGGPGRHMFWKQRMAERWEAMTPEEREKFRQGMRNRCSSFGAPVTEPKA